MTRTKRAIAMAAAMVLTLALAVPALALGEIDAAQPGSIIVKLQEGEDNAAFREDLADAKVGVQVYQVATVNRSGAFGLTDEFKDLQENEYWRGGILTNSADVGSDTQIVELLKAALALVQPAEPTEGEPPAEPAVEPLLETEAAANGGKIELPEGYSQGLFLVIPEKAETALWAYEFNPALLAVPSIQRATAENGLDGDRWQYQVPMYLKGDRERRLTDIVIEKSLPEYNATLGQTTFVFEVTADIDGDVVYRNVVSLTLGGPGTQSTTVSGIPVGAHVTVTEVHSGGSYEPKDGKVTVEIKELPMPAEGDYNRVPFTNTYTNERIPDGSVVNRYVYDGTGWVYEGEKDR